MRRLLLLLRDTATLLPQDERLGHVAVLVCDASAPRVPAAAAAAASPRYQATMAQAGAGRPGRGAAAGAVLGGARPAAGLVELRLPSDFEAADVYQLLLQVAASTSRGSHATLASSTRGGARSQRRRRKTKR